MCPTPEESTSKPTLTRMAQNIQPGHVIQFDDGLQHEVILVTHDEYGVQLYWHPDENPTVRFSAETVSVYDTVVPAWKRLEDLEKSLVTVWGVSLVGGDVEEAGTEEEAIALAASNKSWASLEPRVLHTRTTLDTPWKQVEE